MSLLVSAPDKPVEGDGWIDAVVARELLALEGCTLDDLDQLEEEDQLREGNSSFNFDDAAASKQVSLDANFVMRMYSVLKQRTELFALNHQLHIVGDTTFPQGNC